MRVLIVHNRYREPGGEDAVVRAEAELLEAAGHQVMLQELSNPTSASGTAVAMALAVWNRKAGEQVAALAEKFQPDVAHVHNTWYALSPAVLWDLRDHGAARVATLHNYRLACVNANLYRDGHRCLDCVGHLPWRGVVRRCYRGSLGASLVAGATVTVHRWASTWENQAEVLVVPSALTRDLLVEGGLPEAAIMVKPHFVPDPGARSRPPSASRTLLFAGRFTAEKGLPALLEAWTSMAADDLELLFVGDGELRPELERAARGVRLMTWVPRGELSKLMLDARAVIVPSQLFETFGLTAAEAMAAGAPVVTASGTAVAEIAGDGGPPSVLSPSSTAEWINRLESLKDGVAVDAWGAAGRRRYEQLYSPEKGLEGLLDVYSAAIARRAARRENVRPMPLPADSDNSQSGSAKGSAV